MSIQNPIIITQGNTQDIKVYNLQDIDSGQFWNAATAQATLMDEYGNVVPSIDNVTLNYVAGSNGNYSGSVTTDFSMPIGGGYTLIIDATQNGARFHLELPAQVVARTS